MTGSRGDRRVRVDSLALVKVQKAGERRRYILGSDYHSRAERDTWRSSNDRCTPPWLSIFSPMQLIPPTTADLGFFDSSSDGRSISRLARGPWSARFAKRELKSIERSVGPRHFVWLILDERESCRSTASRVPPRAAKRRYAWRN